MRRVQKRERKRIESWTTDSDAGKGGQHNGLEGSLRDIDVFRLMRFEKHRELSKDRQKHKRFLYGF